jgi:hypothetical protein
MLSTLKELLVFMKKPLVSCRFFAGSFNFYFIPGRSWKQIPQNVSDRREDISNFGFSQIYTYLSCQSIPRDLAVNKRSPKHRLFRKLKYILNHICTVYIILCWYYILYLIDNYVNWSSSLAPPSTFYFLTSNAKSTQRSWVYSPAFFFFRKVANNCLKMEYGILWETPFFC